MGIDGSEPIQASRSPSGAGGEEEEEEGAVGIFPSWRWLYGVVLIYGALMVIALWLLTGLLDPGTAP